MEIIPRSAWGARHPNGFDRAPIPAPECWAHHSVTVAPDLLPPFDDDYAAIRELEAIGQQRFKGGISYTWLITPAGLIFEGHSPDRQGSHTANRNDRARAICFVGNYDVLPITTAQIYAAAWLLQHAAKVGWLLHARFNGGHRDLKATACPGQHVYDALAQINALAAGPPIDTPATKKDDDIMLLVRRQGAPEVWATNFLHRRWISSESQLKGLQWQMKHAGMDPTVQVVADLTPFGVEVAEREDVGYARDQLLRQLATSKEPDALAAAIATRLAPVVEQAVITAVGDSTSVTPDEIHDATRRAVREVLGSVDNQPETETPA